MQRPFLWAGGREVFQLVGLERVWFWTAGPMTAQKHTRRLITLIFAGSRMVMIRRELPRTKRAGWVRKPYRIERKEGSPFRGPCAVTGSYRLCRAAEPSRQCL